MKDEMREVLRQRTLVQLGKALSHEALIINVASNDMLGPTLVDRAMS